MLLLFLDTLANLAILYLLMAGIIGYLLFINCLGLLHLLGVRDRETQVGIAAVSSIACLLLLFSAGQFMSGNTFLLLGSVAGISYSSRKLLILQKMDDQFTVKYPTPAILFRLFLSAAAGMMLAGAFLFIWTWVVRIAFP